MNRLLSYSALASAILVPAPAEALTFVQVLSLFHVATGILLVFTLLVFAAGFFVYIARLGTWPTHRDTAIKVLEWGVTLMFVLIVLLALLRFFQIYTTTALFLFAFIIIIVLAIFIVRAAAAKPPKRPPARGGARPPGK